MNIFKYLSSTGLAKAFDIIIKAIKSHNNVEIGTTLPTAESVNLFIDESEDYEPIELPDNMALFADDSTEGTDAVEHWLQAKDGTIVAPKTHSSAVLDSDGNSIDETLSQMVGQIATKANVSDLTAKYDINDESTTNISSYDNTNIPITANESSGATVKRKITFRNFVNAIFLARPSVESGTLNANSDLDTFTSNGVYSSGYYWSSIANKPTDLDTAFTLVVYRSYSTPVQYSDRYAIQVLHPFNEPFIEYRRAGYESDYPSGLSYTWEEWKKIDFNSIDISRISDATIDEICV